MSADVFQQCDEALLEFQMADFSPTMSHLLLTKGYYLGSRDAVGHKRFPAKIVHKLLFILLQKQYHMIVISEELNKFTGLVWYPFFCLFFYFTFKVI